MGRIGLILGSSAFTLAGGSVAAAAAAQGAAVIQRHGSERFSLPHEVDYGANLAGLIERDCDRVLSIASVGSLKAGTGVGTIVCPDDFIALQVTVTTRSDPSAHMTPGFDLAWRRQVLDAWDRGGAGEVVDGGVYWQTNGPRFETPAEIRLMAAHADVVGMTIASECIVAKELGLPYASLCMVDNLANGLEAEPLSPEHLVGAREANAVRLRTGLEALLPELA